MNDDHPGKPVAPMHTAKSPEKTSARLSRDVQAKIGQQLRSMYDGVVKEGVPDRFGDLLRQLDKSQGAGGEGSRE